MNEATNETMTVQQVLEICINNLNGINVPIAMAKQVGEPIMGVIGNLQLCIQAINKATQEAQKPTPDNTEMIDLGEIGGDEDGAVPDAE